jgi:hypothetical protein
MPSMASKTWIPSPDQPRNQTPLALSDEQLDQIMKCAAPLHPRVRRLFVEHVAARLRGKDIGDGAVFRACAEVLRETGMFDAPLETEEPQPARGRGKYSR